jgi:type IV secretion system protein VirD4
MSWGAFEGEAVFALIAIGGAVLGLADRRSRMRGNPDPRASRYSEPNGSMNMTRSRDPRFGALRSERKPGPDLLGGLGMGWMQLGSRRPSSAPPAKWASGRELSDLVVKEPSKGRLIIGKSGRKLLATESGHSLLVVGPTQSGKTTGLAAPAIREWDGPVVAASVKGDIARLTMDVRSQCGDVLLYDPLVTTGLPRAMWSPIDSCRTWTDARKIATDLAAVAREGASNLSDGDFWFSMAAKLLAPMFLAASMRGHRMSDVVAWIDEHEVDYPLQILTAAGEIAAVQALRATSRRDERQASAIFTTAETVIEAFAEPGVAACEPVGTMFESADPRVIDSRRFLNGSNTLYLCAPPHDQRRLRALFATLVSQVIAEAYNRSMSEGKALDPPLLVVLDEAANIAPLAELDVLASTAAGHGVQLVTVWQDLAQLNARYGTKGSSVINNHRAKVFLSGIADPGTLEHASQLAGEEDRNVRSRTIDHYGSSSVTDGSTPRRLVPPDALRRLPPGSGLLLYAHLSPIQISLRNSFRP